MSRRTISKKRRFAIFARDGFTCRYCGRQSDRVVLVVDHVLAVAHGGTSDDANLATSCEECNSGKGATRLDPAVLRVCQELNEKPASHPLHITLGREQLRELKDRSRRTGASVAELVRRAIDAYLETHHTTEVSE